MRRTIKLEIATPTGLFTGNFPLRKTVEEVILRVVRKMGLDRSEAFDLVFEESVLQPIDQTLSSFGLEDCAELELVATGSGV